MQKEKGKGNRMVMEYLGIPLTSPKWMIEVENSKTEEWPSGHTYMIAEEPEETFRPKDMFSKAEKKTKIGSVEVQAGLAMTWN